MISFLDVVKAVLEEQSFENQMLKSYIKTGRTRQPEGCASDGAGAAVVLGKTGVRKPGSGLAQQHFPAPCFGAKFQTMLPP